jgi:hypothetical protein
LPEIYEELQSLIQKAEDEVRALPKAPSGDPLAEVLYLVGNFMSDLTQHLEGTPEEDGLLQSIRPAQLKFQRAIRATVPRFVPYAKSSANSGRDLPSPTFLANEETESENSFANVVDTKGIIHIDEVFEKAQT